MKNTRIMLVILLVPMLSLVMSFCSGGAKGRPVNTEAGDSGQFGEEWVNSEKGLVQLGVASWYGPQFNGRRTANGEIYDMHKLTAAHKTLPFHTLVEVENLENQKKVLVRINDRGPFVKKRIIDLSKKAARALDMETTGTANVLLRIVRSPKDVGIARIKKNLAEDTGTVPGVDAVANPTQPAPRVQPREAITVSPTPKPAPKPAYTPPPAAETNQTNQADQTDQDDGYVDGGPMGDDGGDFYLQAGAFGSRENADRMLKRIKSILPGVAFKIHREGRWYKIFSRPLESRETAAKWKEYLGDMGIEAFIKEDLVL